MGVRGQPSSAFAHPSCLQSRIQGGWGNVCLTRKNVTKMDINKFCMRFLRFFFNPPPPKKILGMALPAYLPQISPGIHLEPDRLWMRIQSHVTEPRPKPSNRPHQESNPRPSDK
jgi:hypothetical protein